jgi:hypothetical protein
MAATARSLESAGSNIHAVEKSRLNQISLQEDHDEGKPAAASMVMFAAPVTARMTASARVPTAEALPAAEALRRVPAAMEILRRVPAAKHRAARARRLARRSRKALAQRGPVRRLTGIAALIACARRSITGLLPA